ncbi:MAG: Asp-tRNA(Asn)/Glu-tRNA(Gln) amidotransferase subunit GatC [Anaerolineales bacterium]|nr:Asp-tRNA(Asn)/Glu-tRNA(Gln) amidotransferase subunit GatC [Anaerolineales bacterium]
MKLSREEVEHIAELARLGLTEEEMELYREQLSVVLEYMEQLHALDTQAIEPTATVLPLRSVMRPDEVRPSLPRDDLLGNAPDPQEGCFGVPAVMD